MAPNRSSLSIHPRVWQRLVTGGMAVSILLALAELTNRHCMLFRSAESVWRDTLAKNPGEEMAYVQFAATLRAQGRETEALQVDERHVALIDKDTSRLSSQRWNNYGAALLRVGRSADAEAAITRAIEKNGRFAVAFFNLGSARAARGNRQGALDAFAAAVRLNPDLQKYCPAWTMKDGPARRSASER
jgi:tetratricopeptide (TPR) repeat protein